jgi:hypothetical protein
MRIAAVLSALVLVSTTLAGEKTGISVKVIHEWLSALNTSKEDDSSGTPRSADELNVKIHHATMAQHKLMEVLAQEPGLWTEVRRPLYRMLPEKGRLDVRSRVITILAGDKDEKTRKLVIHELKVRPASFDPRTLVQLDQAGVEGARSGMVRLLKEEKPSSRLVMPAVHLAFHGNKVGKPVLEWASNDKKFAKHNGPLQLSVAIALTRLGDEKAWKIRRDATLKEIEGYMEKSNFRAARWLALNLEYFVKLSGQGTKIDVLKVNQKAAAHARDREKAVESPVDLRQLLNRLAAT